MVLTRVELKDKSAVLTAMIPKVLVPIASIFEASADRRLSPVILMAVLFSAVAARVV